MSSPSSTGTIEPPHNSSYKSLLSDADVLRWYRNVQRGSEATADIYLRRPANFCRRNRLVPRQLPWMDEKMLPGLLLHDVTRLKSEALCLEWVVEPQREVGNIKLSAVSKPRAEVQPRGQTSLRHHSPSRKLMLVLAAAPELTERGHSPPSMDRVHHTFCDGHGILKPASPVYASSTE